MRHYVRAVHLDFHTMPRVHDVGADFDARRLARTLAEADIEFVTFFAKCNLGLAYYPTKVGLVHPSLQGDMLGPVVDECHKLGIGVVAYFNAGLDHENASRHRQWCVLNKAGQVHTEDTLDSFFRRMCFNSPYGDYLTVMVQEVLNLYPVDGVFMDCMDLGDACYGRECLDGMVAEGLDVLDHAQVARFSEQTIVRFMERMAKLVGPGRLLYFNGVPYRRQLPYCTHVEIESLPTGVWGYEHFPVMGRYVRTLGKPATFMTGRFHESWGDFGGLRPQASLDFDCYHALAVGLTVSVGDHLHPRGRLERAVYERVGTCYRRIKALAPWTEGAEGIAEMAVVTPAGFEESDLSGAPALAGAVRMLSELNYQFDVIDPDMPLDSYALLVLPDDVPIDRQLKSRLQKHLRRGGLIISSAFAGLDADRTGFALPEWKLKYLGPSQFNVSYYKPQRLAAADLPDMPLRIYEPGIDMRALAGARRLACVHRPYFNRHWDGFQGNVYVPPAGPTRLGAAVWTGRVVHVCFSVFSSYHLHGAETDRTLVRNCIQCLYPQPLVRTENLPPFGRVLLTRKRRETMAHVLCYCPEHKAGRGVVEMPTPVRDVTVKIRTGPVPKAYLAPSGRPLDVWREGKYACVRLDEVRGYQTIVLRHGSRRPGPPR